MSFQKRLNELLEENQINYNILSSKTKIPVTTLSNYINRGSSPSITQLSILADFFNVSIDYLVGREDDFGNITVPGQSTDQLTKDERELLSCFNELGPFERDAILIQIKALSGHKNKKKEEV